MEIERFVTGEDRKEQILLPQSIDECIGEDNPVRFIDAFIESIKPKLFEMGFSRTSSKDTGRKSFSAATMLKLYIYGYFYGIRSSRKLERETHVNIEVIWLLQKLTPDFRTIANFRKDNKLAMKNVFKEFNYCCIREGILKLQTVSIDGSKFKACNSKDNNFTKNKLDDKLTNILSHIQEYMKALENNDENDEYKMSKEAIQEKIDELRQRQKTYEEYLRVMEENNDTQLSLNDPESKLMKTKNGFDVSYNTQTAVDVDTHMVAGFNVTTNGTDHGQITPTIGEIKNDVEKVIGKEITINSIADKGYADGKDFTAAFENGIIPNVIPDEGKEIPIVEFEYSENEISEEQKKSKNTDDISLCLHSGIVPEVYEDILEFNEISNKTYYVYEETSAGVTHMTEDEMFEKAQEGFFVRNVDANYVICPQGQILRQKSVKKDGQIRYCNKLACKKCKHKCTKAEFKEADFSKDTLIRPAPGNTSGKAVRAGLNRVKRTRKLVSYTFKLDFENLAKRMSTSEHVFGTIKRTMNSGYLLCKGKDAAEAENALSFLAYNMKRVLAMGKKDQIIKSFEKK